MSSVESQQEIFKQVLIAATEKAELDHTTLEDMINDITQMLLPIVKSNV